MRKPMLTSEAEARFPCTCAHTPATGCSCTESATCSTRCSGCGERVWFVGTWGDGTIPSAFRCPACSGEMHDPSTAAGREERQTWRMRFRGAIR